MFEAYPFGYKFTLGGEHIMKKTRGIQFLPKEACFDVMDSPVGNLTIITSPEGLHAILWDTDVNHLIDEKNSERLIENKKDEIILQTKAQLIEYFTGKRKIFDLPIVMKGTDFQIQVWQQLLKIPYSQTVSYAEQAARIGNKNKARAVGRTNGLNPISIVIPCHRVVGSNGSLVGFAGGLSKKDFLLKLEQKLNHAE